MSDDAHRPPTNANDQHLHQLLDILKNPEDRIVPLLYGAKDDENRNQTRQQLVEITKKLFVEIEDIGKELYKLDHPAKKHGHDELEDKMIPTLSGLDELYVPEPTVGADGKEILDMDTILGQVELQNKGANKLSKRAIKKLEKAPQKIRLLDMSLVDSSDSEDSDTDGDNSEEEAEEKQAEESSASDMDEEDEEARRIRERMDRAMDDMEEGEEKGGESDESSEPAPKKPEEELFDPVAEDLKDGFFDLNEMEDFADEEEDFLPEEAYGKPEKKTKESKKKKTFHQMQRDGDLLGDASDNDDDFEEMYEDSDPVRRKNYRKSEDIDSLYALYQTPDSEDDDADGEDDPATMMAADFFGQPKVKYIEQYKKNAIERAKEEVKNDDDSWGEYDFENEDEGKWREEDADEKMGNRLDEHASDEEGNGDKEDDDGDDDEEEGSHDKEDSVEGKAKKPEDKSEYGKDQAKIRKQTEEIEQEFLREKPWKMRGEIKAVSRPANSLLDNTPDFEMAGKRAPLITVEHTANLEDVIKKRILAEDWDDVVPRELPDVGWNKKRGEIPEVSQEKSKLGLGELYEREYLKKAVGYDVDAAEKQTEEDKAKDEMKQLFANLCSKLDALSNYHFAPRPVQDEAEVRTVSTPAIAMEEVLPLHVSDARGVAPEEVFASKRGREGILRGEDEMDQTERKRLRSSKKAARRKARKEKLADDKLISRLEPGLGLNNPYEKRKMREELAMARSRGRFTEAQQEMDNKFGSSGTFFKRLQTEAQQAIQGEAGGQEKKEKQSKAKSSAFKL